MGSFINSSIGKKFLISITGLFLISFLAVHLATNLFLFAGQESYNLAAHFMATDKVVGFLEPLLAAGFLLHIVLTIFLTMTNQNVRPHKFSMVDQRKTSSWPSRNMFVLGGLILIFLILHLSNFWYKMKFGEMDYILYDDIMVQDAYSLVTGKFIIWWYVLLYVAGAVFLGMHLIHGFQSAFLTLGLYNEIWRGRLMLVGAIYAIVIASGFSVIPVYFLIGHLTG